MTVVDFELIQEAYHDAYIRADLELMTYLQHREFIFIRDGAVRNKLEFLKIVRTKSTRGFWYETGQPWQFTHTQITKKGNLTFSVGALTLINGTQKTVFHIHELWVFDEAVSWKILNFIFVEQNRSQISKN
jgi:hypothetical protein